LAVLGGWFGSGAVVAGAGDPTVANILLENRQSLLEYEEAGQDLRNTPRQISQKQNDHRVALEEQQETNTALRWREQALDRAIDLLGASKERTEDRLHELEAAERARVSRGKVATGGGEASGRSELELAHDDVVAEAVEPISEERYMKLYRESARMYGFGPDWYILAAVGKVESDHGGNMGDPPALARWAPCSSCPLGGRPRAWTATATGPPISWTPKTPYQPPPGACKSVERRKTGTGPCTHTTTPTGT
jgi:hypothetical protein